MMEWILDPAHAHLLRPLHAAEALLVFDYDGTLAPIVPDPTAAFMRPETHALLVSLSRLYPVAILTGRSRHDVLRFLQGVPAFDVIGNHGIEVFGATLAPSIARVADWRRDLDERLEGLPGVVVEDKRCSLSVHYREAPDPLTAERAIRRVASDLEGARLIHGKRVVNVVLADAPDKGMALQRLRGRLADPPTMFVGDDDTDEDVFRLSVPGLLGVRVEPSPESAAGFFLHDQSEIDGLLERMINGAKDRARHRPSTTPDFNAGGSSP